MNEDQVSVPVNLLSATVEYLSARPVREVVNIWATLNAILNQHNKNLQTPEAKPEALPKAS